jgi:hypothetical protein
MVADRRRTVPHPEAVSHPAKLPQTRTKSALVKIWYAITALTVPTPVYRSRTVTPRQKRDRRMHSTTREYEPTSTKSSEPPKICNEVSDL